MGRYFIGRYFLCLNLVGRDSLVFFSFAVLFCRTVSIFSARKCLRDFYNVKYTRILKTRLFLRFRPLSVLFSWPLLSPLPAPPFRFYFPFPSAGPYFSFLIFFFHNIHKKQTNNTLKREFNYVSPFISPQESPFATLFSLCVFLCAFPCFARLLPVSTSFFVLIVSIASIHFLFYPASIRRAQSFHSALYIHSLSCSGLFPFSLVRSAVLCSSHLGFLFGGFCFFCPWIWILPWIWNLP